VAQRIVQGMSSCSGRDSQSDENYDNADDGPRCAEGINCWKISVPPRTDDKCDKTDGVKYQKQLPTICSELGTVDSNSGRDQGRKSKVDREGDCPVPYEPYPPIDEREGSLYSFAIWKDQV
jgi:hypothetical protein